jgi:serine protease AprX
MQLPFVDDLRIYQPPLSLAARLNADARYTGRGVTIAYLDSGFFAHPDLTRPRNRVLVYADATGARVIERHDAQMLHPTSWHGTMTSGATAGNGGLSKGRFKGLASAAKLVLVKTGQPDTFRISERDIARSLNWVLSNQARFNIGVINISLGGDTPSKGVLTPLDRLVEEAVARGMVVVCASGNSGSKRIVPPASAPSAITVGGLNDMNSPDRTHWRMYHSSHGSGAQGSIKPEVIAPAQFVAAPMLPGTEPHKRAHLLWQLENASDPQLERLLRTKPAQDLLGMDVQKRIDVVRRIVRKLINDGKFVHPDYQHVDGTSFAAPIVSAVAAQMLEANPALKPAQIKSILIDTAEALPDVPVERQGAGLVNAGAAVRAALTLTEKVRGRHRS